MAAVYYTIDIKIISRMQTMEKIKFNGSSKKNFRRVAASVLLCFVILSVNIYYYSNIEFGSSITSTLPGILESPFADESEPQGKLAIIIDDFGQNRLGVKEMMTLDRHMTFAIMPFLTFSQSDAETAHKNGFEIIVHLPMESYSGKLSWVGPRPILSVLSDQEIYNLVIDAFDSVPYAVGANIHMGAKAGGDERVISDVLDVIKVKNLYFVDSRSARKPIAKGIADEKGVLCYDRDVFLDTQKDKAYIKKQLKRAGEIALKKGYAVAIGHVGTEGGKITYEAIKETLPYFDSNNIQLVYVSELGK